MWKIYCNVPITRRKSYYLIQNPEGDITYRDKKLWPCVLWMDAEGISCYKLLPGDPDEEPDRHLFVELRSDQ